MKRSGTSVGPYLPQIRFADPIQFRADVRLDNGPSPFGGSGPDRLLGAAQIRPSVSLLSGSLFAAPFDQVTQENILQEDRNRHVAQNKHNKVLEVKEHINTVCSNNPIQIHILHVQLYSSTNIVSIISKMLFKMVNSALLYSCTFTDIKQMI